LLALNRHYLSLNGNGESVLTTQIGVGSQIIPPVRIEADAVIGPACIIGPYVYVEQGTRIGAGAQLAHSVVLRGSQVEAGRQITGEVVM
jgi:NDP-sugar pyrophosphorylase family protein